MKKPHISVFSWQINDPAELGPHFHMEAISWSKVCTLQFALIPTCISQDYPKKQNQ